MLGGVSALLLAVVLSLSLAAGYLVRFIPFSQEQALASRIEQQWLKPGSIAQPERQAFDCCLGTGLSDGLQMASDTARLLQIAGLCFRFADINWQENHPHLSRLYDKLMLRSSFADTVPHD